MSGQAASTEQLAQVEAAHSPLPTASLKGPAARPRRALADRILRAASPLALLLWWAACSELGWIEEATLSPPGKVLDALLELVRSGVLASNLAASLQRVAYGASLGVSAGLVLGLVTGLSRTGDRLIDPLLQMLRAVPFLAIAPLLVLWFGIGEQQKVLLIALASGFPFYLNTHAGAQSADPKLLEAASVFGLSRLGSVRQIIVPAAIPHMLVGLRQSLGVALIALIVAEQTNAPRGLGFLMLSASQFFQTEILLVCILLYGVWGLLSDLFVRALARVLMPWRSGQAER